MRTERVEGSSSIIVLEAAGSGARGVERCLGGPGRGPGEPKGGDGPGSVQGGLGEAGGGTGRLRVLTLRQLLEEPQEPRRALLEPWLRERHLALLYAPSGVGKSWLALSVALALAGGGGVPGLGSAPSSGGEKAARKVLYVDGEMDISDIQDRAKMLLERLPGVGRAAAEGNLSYFARMGQPGDDGLEFPDLAESAGQEALLALADEVGADLVVLDNLSTLATIEDENDASAFNSLLKFLVELKRRGKAVLVVHHSRKASGGDGAYRGSQKQSVIMDTIIRLEKPKAGAVPAERGGGAAFTLHWEKSRELREGSQRGALLMSLGADGWQAEIDQDERMAALVAELTSGRQPSLRAAARAVGLPVVTAWRLQQRAIGLGLLSVGEHARAVRGARAANDCEGELDGMDELDRKECGPGIAA